MNVTKKAGVRPVKFTDLNIAELRRSAVADFAVDVKETDNENVVLAALTEAGIEWSDYVAQHPDIVGEIVEVVAAPDTNAVTAADVTGRDGASSAPELKQEVEIIVAEKPAPLQKYLIKMVRENPLYQIRGYTFTDTHPYALVDPKDVDAILDEEGFRQAKPGEAADFYEL